MAFQKPIKVGSSQIDSQLAMFPSSRYMGSKHTLLPFIYEVMSSIEFTTALDAFSGSAAVSYLMKAMGKSVTANDFLTFAYRTSQACIENRCDRLSGEEVDSVLAPHPSAANFIASTFQGLYFSDEENRFLDNLSANIQALRSQNKKSIALAAIARACFRRRPRGLFTYTGTRYIDGRRDLNLTLEQHFRNAVDVINRAVFDNGQINRACNLDTFCLPEQMHFDLVYIDPPYVSNHSDNDYTRRYHFVEGLTRYWEGLEILERTSTKKFRRYPSPFDSKKTVHQAFCSLFDRFRDSVIVVSYSSNGIPTRDELAEMLYSYKSSVTIYSSNHRYSFGTHKHKVGDNRNDVEEYLFVGL